MGQVAVFIDGGYLDKVVYYDHQNKRLDYEKLVAEIAKPDELLRTYYYHCWPYQSNPPTPEESQRFKAEVLHRAIALTPLSSKTRQISVPGH